jgi:hypothetical protein
LHLSYGTAINNFTLIEIGAVIMNYHLKIKHIALIACLLLLGSVSFAATGDAGSAAAFLRTGVGARALAMSGAFTAYYDDSTCAYWNPAATAYLKDISVSTMFSLLTSQRDYNYFNVVFPTTYGTIGLNYINFSVSNIEGRLSDTASFYTFSDSENAYFISYGKEFFKDISAGFNIKFLQTNLETYGANGFSADAALHIKLSPLFNLGIVLQDLGGSMQWTTGTQDQIPFVIRAGIMTDLLDNSLKTSLELVENEFEGLTTEAGAEYTLFKIFALRGGVSYDSGSQQFNFSLGAGAKYTLGNILFQFDYAFLNQDYYNSFQADHKFSLNMYFP